MCLPFSSSSPYFFVAGVPAGVAAGFVSAEFVKNVVIVNVPVTVVPADMWNFARRWWYQSRQLQVADVDDSRQAAHPREEIENRVVWPVGLNREGHLEVVGLLCDRVRRQGSDRHAGA